MTNSEEQNIISGVEPTNLTTPTSASEPKNTISKILNYKKEGYLFHGSPNPDITVLEPRQANDSDKNIYNSDNAVYASDNPLVCIIGIVENSFKGLPGTFGLGSYGNGPLIAEIPKSWKERVEKSSGNLYILPPESFEKGSVRGWQWKSFQSVAPVDKILVTLNDFIALGGKVVWTE